MRICFTSLNEKWIKEMKKYFQDNSFTFFYGDVQEIERENTVFVSPANCLGFMDGGIDYVYSYKMFPGCEKEVRKVISEIGFKTALGRSYLPIGSAFSISVGETTGLICAPTMFLPHNVSKTRNAYLSFLASLLVFEKEGKYESLVITSHCCGYGQMSEEESAKQFKQAYTDFINKKYDKDSSNSNTIVLMPIYDEEQPDNFDNREIKNIPIERLMSNK